MDIDKFAEDIAEAIMGRIEYDRAIHKSSLVEEIQKAMKAPWSSTPPMPNMVDLNQLHVALHQISTYTNNSTMDFSAGELTITNGGTGVLVNADPWAGVVTTTREISPGQYDLQFDADGTIKIVKVGS